MSKNIDIELIIAYINDEITDSHTRKEVRDNIENDVEEINYLQTKVVYQYLRKLIFLLYHS